MKTKLAEPASEPPSPSFSLQSAAELVVFEHAAAPCAVVAASVGRGETRRRGLGVAGWLERGSSVPARRETPFDLASLTKSVVALTLARLSRSGALGRHELLGDVLPLVADTPSASMSLDLLSAHRAGLEAHVKIFAPLVEGRAVDRNEALLIAAHARRPEATGAPPVGGFAPVYSDMGYLLLGAAIECRCGAPLDEVVRRETTGPIGIADRVGSARQLLSLGHGFASLVAPTEDVAFRGGVVRGLVHDENAFAVAHDRMCGHAGLFGDAESVLAIGQAVLECLDGEHDFLDPGDLHPLLMDRPSGSLLAGFDRKSGDAPSAGSRTGPRTFGHLGFTGTSIWIDPDAAFVGVLLSNRVNPTREHIAIRAARPAAYDAMWSALAVDARFAGKLAE